MTGTPTFVIDGKVYGGELTIDQLKAILDPIIKVALGGRLPGEKAPASQRADADADERGERIPGRHEWRRIVGAGRRIDQGPDACRGRPAIAPVRLGWSGAPARSDDERHKDGSGQHRDRDRAMHRVRAMSRGIHALCGTIANSTITPAASKTNGARSQSASARG